MQTKTTKLIFCWLVLVATLPQNNDSKQQQEQQQFETDYEFSDDLLENDLSSLSSDSELQYSNETNISLDDNLSGDAYNDYNDGYEDPVPLDDYDNGYDSGDYHELETVNREAKPHKKHKRKNKRKKKKKKKKRKHDYDEYEPSADNVYSVESTVDPLTGPPPIMKKKKQHKQLSKKSEQQAFNIQFNIGRLAKVKATGKLSLNLKMLASFIQKLNINKDDNEESEMNNEYFVKNN